MSFGRMFQFQHVLNGYIPGRAYMPVGYGQLGCSGFVISDRQGCFVSRKTNAFLTYGESAFHDVERILDGLVEGNDALAPNAESESLGATLPDAYPYATGSIAIIDGPVELTGKEAKILGFDNTHGKFRVELQDDSRDVVSVLPCCLAPRASMRPATIETSTSRRPDVASSASLTRIAYPSSVGVDCMDDEHRRCSDAINLLLHAIATKGDEGVTPAMLRDVLDLLEEHFDHEEQIMRSFPLSSGQGSSGTTFSAEDSHFADHARILSLGRSEVERVLSRDEECLEGACGPRRVNPNVVKALARSFVEHAETFDSLYSDHIPRQAK
jgi:Hemerythrin HHE cation binding domain